MVLLASQFNEWWRGHPQKAHEQVQERPGVVRHDSNDALSTY